MNKSEIAERAVRRAHREIMKFALQLGCNLADSDWEQFDALVEAAVERAIAESQSWISVEEKLPPRNIDVIVALDADGDSPRESAVDHMTGAGWYHHLEKYVTHWMHLPERK